MSSSESARRPGSTPEFVPLGGPRMTGTLRAAGVFPDFDARRTHVDAPPSPAAAVPTAAEEARREGYAAGLIAGRAAAEAELASGAAAFEGAVEELARFRSALLERYQQELLELAIGVARKVVHQELADHPEHWMKMIQAAVLAALDRESIRLRVGPVLHRYLVERLPQLHVLLDEVKELDLVQDVTLGDTACIVESRYGELDVGVDGQMSAIRAALTGAEET